MVENFPVNHPFEELVEKQGIQRQKEKAERVN